MVTTMTTFPSSVIEQQAAAETVPLPLLGGHGYRVGSAVYPSVTTVLGACGLGPALAGDFLIDAATLEEAAARGKFVHERAASYWSSPTSLLDGCPEEWSGYLIAFEAAAKALKLSPERVETVAHSSHFRLAGRIDFTGKDSAGQLLIDYKTGPPDEAHALQTGAYSLLVNTSGEYGRFYHRDACLYLASDGKWSFVEQDDWRSESVVKAAAIIANARLDRAKVKP